MSGCVEDRVDRDLVAVDDVEDAVRDARPRRSSSARKLAADGSFSDGLRMNVLPRRDGRREHPHRDHRREVERGDAGHHAERLADLVDVDAARDLLGEAALEQARDAARELEVLEAAGDLAEGIGRDLAVLGGEQRGDLLAVRLDAGSGSGT